MGCDIHPTWEVFTEKTHRWVNRGYIPHAVMGRDYTFFSLIADVRNGSPSESRGYVEPLFDNRDLPDDCTASVRREYERGQCDYHSQSWFLLSEFKEAYEGDMKDKFVEYHTLYNILSYYKYKKGINDDYGLWNVDNSMGEVILDRFDVALSHDSVKCMLELNAIPEHLKKSYVKLVRRVPYTEEFKNNYDLLMTEAKVKFGNKALDKIRVVFWFDN